MHALKSVFHRRDQVVLNVLKNLDLNPENDENVSKDFTDISASIVPQTGIE